MKFKTHSTVLDGILHRAAARLEADKSSLPLHDLKKRLADAPPPVSLQSALAGPFGLIAEIKRKSPSQGVMLRSDIAETARIYQAHPIVRAISVLTNRDDFDMTMTDLANVKNLTTKPVLRKDFIFDEYQVFEARAFGADAILLMASVITDSKLMHGLFDLATNLGMDVLFECRSVEDINFIPKPARIFGINSRKLKARQWFGISRYTLAKLIRPVVQDKSIEFSAFDLVKHLPPGVLKVAESGLSPKEIHTVTDRYNCALVGTSILNATNGPKAELDAFAAELASRDISHNAPVTQSHTPGVPA